MDKTEYKIRAEEIKSLIKAQRYADAVKIADTIDWKRVKSVGMLCAISDLYKVNRRLEESRDILLLAYDRSPTRREIVYSLCELAIAMGEFVQAVEYYKEFVRLAPRNTARYILQYKLYEAQEVSLEERIAVLEEYKKHDYNEKWAYELAYLYHRVGLTTECIEECDELFVYMREGRYVIKALELKALHEPLSPQQKAVYAQYKSATGGTISAPEMRSAEMGRDVQEGTKTPTKELPQVPEDFEAGDLAKANTTEIRADEVNEAVGDGYQYEQEYTAESDINDSPTQIIGEAVPYTEQAVDSGAESVYNQETQLWGAEEVQQQIDNTQEERAEYEVPTVNVGDYNTVDLQKEIAENLKEVLIASPEAALFADANGPKVDHEAQDAEDSGEMYDTTDTIDIQATPSMSEVFYEDKTSDINPEAVNEELPVEESVDSEESMEMQDEAIEPAEEETPYAEPTAQTSGEPIKKPSLAEELKDKEIAANIAAATLNEHALYKGAVFTDEPLQDEVPGAVIKPNVRYQINNHFDKMLSQEYDGQISMAIDEQKQVEQQITGQISIGDFMTDWESYKKDQQQKQLDNVKKLVASETGELFKDFDETAAKPLLEEELEEIEEPKIKEVLMPEHEIPAVSQDIVPMEDLQNTQSMVQITGEDLEFASTISEQEEVPQETEELPEEDGEYYSEEELMEDYPDDEDISEDEYPEEDILEEPISDNGLHELVYTPEEEVDAAEVDLGETTEIESAEVEKVINELESEEADTATSEPEISEETEITEEPETTEEQVTSDTIEDSEETEASEDSLEEDTGSEEEPQEEELPKETEEKTSKPDNKVKEEEEDTDEKEDKALETRVRVMTPEEKELFGPYIQHRKSRKQIIEAIDNLSMAAYTNNAIVTGEEGAGTVNLAKGLIKAVQATDSNFSGKVAMISAITLNKKSVSTIFDKIVNGALIIRRAADLKEDTVATILKQLQIENKGYIVIIEDTKDDIDRLLDKYPDLKKCFNVRVDIEALDDDSLVAYAKQYALEKEHVIDNLGILALHQKISERQTVDHEVTVTEVKEMVDDAIYYADKASVGHVVDVIFRKRFDEDDMIILREKDFLH
ncbi:tetratricopeptide repeat protein [Butyrivibrio sp. MB2005]|uniref:tetratricopeptide repeat protein n=1 Tax=Butyrivibrio sp. MB2005 TaxID=1280678 RepID=UPI00040A8209|nr:hypothetical protein [Butyrivibrio sp. MB2005]